MRGTSRSRVKIREWSGLDDAFAGADRHTGRRVIVADTVDAFSCINDIGIVAGRNGLYRTFRFAGTTHDA